MTKPEYGKMILAVDPGYRVGCKITVLDRIGNPLLFDKIYLHEAEKAKEKLTAIIKKQEIEVVVVGNGTACDDATALISEVFSGDILLVNESGASVYSVSEVAEAEFPELDSLDRGTVSIGRRYIDPLSELVKVPVGSIGVGMYQHDMPEKKLAEKLGYVVEDVVNQVGINVNNASVHVLQHVSGIDKRQAKKIYEHRPYASRKALKKVLSEKAYEMAIGFLRVPESAEPLDATDIHPDQYPLARYVLDNHISEKDFESHKTEILTLYPDANRDTIAFILTAHANLGTEKRVKSTHQKAKKKLNPEDIKMGDMFE